jgi:hypothetical protein
MSVLLLNFVVQMRNAGKAVGVTNFEILEKFRMTELLLNVFWTKDAI